jgi:hypothetical protein
MPAFDCWPHCRGRGKAGLIGGAGVGETVLLQVFIRTLNRQRAGVAVFAGVGQLKIDMVILLIPADVVSWAPVVADGGP